MATMNVATEQQKTFTNQLLHGDCIPLMRKMSAYSVNFILTDPPYLVNHRDRDGRTIQNDMKAGWLKPAMAEAGLKRVSVVFVVDDEVVISKSFALILQSSGYTARFFLPTP